MKLLITGSSGFIGRELVRQAVMVGHEIVPFDEKGGAVVEEAWAWRDVAPCDAVIHLAGVLGTTELYERPPEAIEVNVIGTARALLHCLACKARYVGITMPRVWQNVYSLTKRHASDWADLYVRDFGVTVTEAIVYNAFGSGQSVGPPRKLVPATIVDLLEGRRPIIYGDGTQTVDLVHVTDVARALIGLATHAAPPRYLEVGTGQPLSVNEVVSQIAAEIGTSIEPEYLPMRRGEAEYTELAADTTQIENVLGWKPKFRRSDLARTVNWYQARHTKVRAA